MRRLSILLAFGLVFVLFVVAAATAAPPKDFCGPDGTKPDHTSCETPPTTAPSTTTTPPPASGEDCMFDSDGVLVGGADWTPNGRVNSAIEFDGVTVVRTDDITLLALERTA